MKASKGSAAAVPEMFIFRWDDHTIVMSTEIWQKPKWFQRILTENEYTRRQALEAAENLKHILAIVADRHGLAVRPYIHEFLDNPPRFRIDNDRRTVMGLGIEHRDEHLTAIHRETKMERAGKLAYPSRVLHKGELLPVARIGIRCIEHRHIVLLDVVHHCVVLAVWREPGLMSNALDVVEVTFPHIGI